MRRKRQVGLGPQNPDNNMTVKVLECLICSGVGMEKLATRRVWHKGLKKSVLFSQELGMGQPSETENFQTVTITLQPDIQKKITLISRSQVRTQTFIFLSRNKQPLPPVVSVEMIDGLGGQWGWSDNVLFPATAALLMIQSSHLHLM